MSGKKMLLLLGAGALCLPLLGTGAAMASTSPPPDFFVSSLAQLPAPTPGSVVLLAAAALVVILKRDRSTAIHARA